MSEPKLWDQTDWPPFDGMAHAEVAHYMELLWSKSLEDTARLILHLERHIKLEHDQVKGWRELATKRERQLETQQASFLKGIRNYLKLENRYELKSKRKRKEAKKAEAQPEIRQNGQAPSAPAIKVE